MTSIHHSLSSSQEINIFSVNKKKDINIFHLVFVRFEPKILIYKHNLLWDYLIDTPFHLLERGKIAKLQFKPSKFDQNLI